MKKTSIIFTLIVASVFILSSCYRDSEEGLYRFVQPVCDTTNITYSGTIQAIMAGNCVTCHSTANPSGGWALDSYAGIKVVVDNGKLVNSVTYTSNGMPKTGKMPSCQVNQIVAWVHKGAPNN
ncbi:MAG: hypothetical protein WCL51_14000 [Bacteroidota bacterium]|jgi:mono/diheme cytochrome c family protein